MEPHELEEKLWTTEYFHESSDLWKIFENLDFDVNGFLYFKENAPPHHPASIFISIINTLLPQNWNDEFEPNDITKRFKLGGRIVSGMNNRIIKGIDPTTISYIYTNLLDNSDIAGNPIKANSLFVFLGNWLYYQLKKQKLDERKLILCAKLIFYIVHPFLSVLDDPKLLLFNYHLLNAAFSILNPGEYEQMLQLRQTSLNGLDINELNVEAYVNLINTRLGNTVHISNARVIGRPKALVHMGIKYNDHRNLCDILAFTIVTPDSFDIGNNYQEVLDHLKQSGIQIDKIEDFYNNNKSYNSDYNAIHLDCHISIDGISIPIEVRLVDYNSFESNRTDHNILKGNIQSIKRISVSTKQMQTLSRLSQLKAVVVEELDSFKTQLSSTKIVPLRTTKGFNCVLVKKQKLSVMLRNYSNCINSEASKIARGYILERNEQVVGQSEIKFIRRKFLIYKITEDDYIVYDEKHQIIDNFELKPFDSLSLLQASKSYKIELFKTLDAYLEEISNLSLEEIKKNYITINQNYIFVPLHYILEIKNRLDSINDLLLSDNKEDIIKGEELYNELYREFKYKMVRIEYLDAFKPTSDTSELNKRLGFIRSSREYYFNMLVDLEIISLINLSYSLNEDSIQALFGIHDYIEAKSYSLTGSFFPKRIKLLSRLLETYNFQLYKKLKEYIEYTKSLLENSGLENIALKTQLMSNLDTMLSMVNNSLPENSLHTFWPNLSK